MQFAVVPLDRLAAADFSDMHRGQFAADFASHPVVLPMFKAYPRYGSGRPYAVHSTAFFSNLCA